MNFRIIGLVVALIVFATGAGAGAGAQPAELPEQAASYGYDAVAQRMTDTNGLTYKTETNGVLTVNNERYLVFALKGTVGVTEYTYTSMDFQWTWHMEQNGEDYVFWAENDNPSFIWRQYYYFYQDPLKPMKIKHYLKNDLADITDMQMYYLLTVSDDDIIERNMTEHRVGDVKPFHATGNFNNEVSIVNFNDMFDFNFEDLINTGFTINEFYIGSGSVIGYPALDIMAVGFTKNSGYFPKGYDVWVDPTFSTDDVESISICPLDSNTIIVSWADETNDDRTFAIYDTNGTLKVGPIDVDEDAGSAGYNCVSCVAFNSTHFVIGWYDDVDRDISFKIYDSSGNNLTDIIDVSTDSAANFIYPYVASVSAFNSTHFVIGWFDKVNQDASFRIYDSSGNPITGIVDADTAVGTSCYSVSVSALNATSFVIGWFDDAEEDASFRIYDSSGNNLTDIIDADDTVGGSSYSVSVSAFNSTCFVIGWYNSVDINASFRIYDSSGNPITGIVDADTDNGNSRSVSVSSLNSTHLVIGWFDETDGDASFRVYDSSGNAVTEIIDADTTANGYQDVSSYESATGIGICDNNFVMGWSQSATVANWSAFYGHNGSVWNGICEEAPVADETPPTYSDNSTNTTYAGQDILHSMKWTDETGLATTGGYIFSFDNGTGSFTNDSWSAFSSNPDWSNMTKSVNTTAGTTIQWKVYANDTSDNWATSSTYSYLTTTADSCTPPAINNDWTITDVCVKDNVNIEQGTGSLIIDATAGGLLILKNGATVQCNDLQFIGSGQHINIFSGDIIT